MRNRIAMWVGTFLVVMGMLAQGALPSGAGGPVHMKVVAGDTVELTAVVTADEAVPVWYKWDFGDGSQGEPARLAGSASYAVAAAHQYVGNAGAIYAARVLVAGSEDMQGATYAPGAGGQYVIVGTRAEAGVVAVPPVGVELASPATLSESSAIQAICVPWLGNTRLYHTALSQLQSDGLLAEYFSGRTFETLCMKRADLGVDFDWGGGSPDALVPSDNFCVRWTGKVEAEFSETYTFYTVGDDGIRLWVNGQQLVNDWTEHGPTERSGTIALQAGVRYDIRMEYYENWGGAVARLLWSSASRPKEIIPGNRLFAPYIWTNTAVSTVLKGVVKTPSTNAVWYRWDFGDGTSSSTSVLRGAVSYVVEASHAYAGAEKTPFTARLMVADNSRLDNAISDTYYVRLEKNDLDSRVNVTIDNGLWDLYKRGERYVNHTTFRSMNGRPVTVWRVADSWVGNFFASPAASAIHAFQINGHKATGNPDEDPYVEAVAGGLNWLFNGYYSSLDYPMLRAYPSFSTNNPAGKNPDANGNRAGIEVRDYDYRPIYEGGIVMDAIVSSGTPLANTGRDFDGDGVNDTYGQVLQDMCDMYAYGQYDGEGGRGGWRYSWDDWPDNSACQWAAIGLIPAQEAPWRCIVPDWVKQRNNDGWLVSSFNNAADGRSEWGGFGYTGSGPAWSYNAVTPSGMVQLDFAGVGTNDARWVKCCRYLADNWATWLATDHSGNRLYAYYAFAKAMRLANGAGPSGLVALPGSSGSFDWYRGDRSHLGLAQKLTSEMMPSGRYSGEGYFGSVLRTSWAIVILRPALFVEPPEAYFTVHPNPAYTNLPVSFDPSGSGHARAGWGITNLASFEWDWESDGVYDLVTNLPVKVEHTFGCAGLPCYYKVTLRVSDVTNVTDTFAAEVRITDPPHAPSAEVDGPYWVSLASGDTLTILGRGHDPDEGKSETNCQTCEVDRVKALAWDLDGTPWTFVGPTGGVVELGVGFTQHFGVARSEPYHIGLRVTDNTSKAFPGSQVGDLTGDGFNDVYVYGDGGLGLPLITATNCEALDLVWNDIGAESYEVYRSQLDINRGMTFVAAVGTNTSIRLRDIKMGVAQHYRVLAVSTSGVAYLSKAVSITPADTLCDPVAVIRAPAQVFVAQDVVLDAEQSFANKGTITHWNWDTNNDGVYNDGDSLVVTTRFTTAGSGVVGLRVTSVSNGEHRYGTASATISVVYRPPAACFAGSVVTGAAPLTVDFTDCSDNPVTGWSWDFNNDGVVDSTNRNPTYMFGGAGSYSVSLTVVGPGGTNTMLKENYISVEQPVPAAPVAGLIATPVSGIAPLTVELADDSSGVITSWDWDYTTDGIVDVTSQNTHCTYTEPGSYSVRLTVRGPGGTSTADRAIAVYRRVAADFSADVVSGEAPLTVRYTDASAGDIAQWVWELDGRVVTNAAGTPVVQVYDRPGVYSVRLTVLGNGGQDSMVRVGYITVAAPPAPVVADFSATPLQGQAPIEVLFTDASSGTITNRTWDLGDGTVTNNNNNELAPFRHTYTTGGVYTVRLTVSGPSGVDTMTKTGFFNLSSTNRAPSACAVRQQVYLESLGDSAVLDASCSSDPDGDALFFSWRESTLNPQLGLLPIGADSLSKLQLYFPTPGRYYYQVQVSDGLDNSPNSITFTVYVPGLKGVVNVSPTVVTRLPDARITAYASQEDALSQTNPVDIMISDSLGRYALENVAPETTTEARNYWINVTRSGFVGSTENQTMVQPDPGATPGATDWSLIKGFTNLAGRVVTTNGEAIYNATVNVILGNGGDVRTSATDTNGSFVIGNVPIGNWLVQVWGPVGGGYQPVVRDIVVRGDEPIEVRLPAATQGSKMLGYVLVAGTKHPVEGAKVYLDNVYVVSDNNGYYEFDAIPSGTYVVRVEATGFETLRYPAVTVNGLRRQTLPLNPRGIRVSGLITDAVNGRPIHNAAVKIGDPKVPTREGVTDHSGYYRLLDMPTATNLPIRVEASGYVTKDVNLPILASANVHVQLQRGPDWQKKEKPVRGSLWAGVAQSELYLADMSGCAYLSAVGSTGSNLVYLWRECVDNPEQGKLPAGAQYSNVVSICGLKYPGIYIYELRVQDSVTREISPNIAAVTIYAPGLAGNVHKSPSDGLFGVSKATVRAYADYASALAWGTNYLDQIEANDNPAGDFAFQRLTTGSVWVVSRSIPPGQGGNGEPGYNTYGPVRKRINFSSASRAMAVNLPVDEVLFQGVVQDSVTRQPLMDARVVVAPGIESQIFRMSTATNGTFRFDEIPQGNGQIVMITRDGYKPFVTTLNLTNGLSYTALLVKNDEGSTAVIRGRVTANYRGVMLPVHHAEVTIGAGLHRTYTDGNGEYEVRDLPAGNYFGFIRKKGYVSAQLGDGLGIVPVSGTTRLDKVLAVKGEGATVRLVVEPPVPDVTVIVVPPDLDVPGIFSKRGGRTLLSESGSTSGDDGLVQLSGVPEGEQSVALVLNDGRVLRRTLNVGGNMLALVNLGTVAAPDSFTTWAERFFSTDQLLNTGVTGVDADADGDGLSNYEEFLAQTDPTNSASRFVMGDLLLDRSNRNVFQIRLPLGAKGRTYDIFWSTNLPSGQWYQQAESVTLDNDAGALVLSVTNTPASATRYYRVRARKN